MRCNTCGTEVDIESNVRVWGKRAQTYRCGVCATRIGQLRRDFGEWPTPQFNQITRAERETFYRHLHTLYGHEQVAAFAEEVLRKVEHHEDYYDEGGSFLPLSIWAVKGYDTDKIIENSKPENCRQCAVVGSVYRIPITSGGKKG